MCRYFLDAIENNKYGWFWVCPGGADVCMYRHALPPGFVLKKDKKKEEREDEISLEELIENEVCIVCVQTSHWKSDALLTSVYVHSVQPWEPT